MKTIIALLIASFMLAGCLQKPSYSYSGDSTGGTSTYTDMFGNKKTCTTIMIGQQISTRCN